MSKITWVAECGSMHKGSPALAYELIRRFSEAGATICKFQFGWTKESQEKMGLDYNPIRYVDEWAPDLAKWCDMYGVELMASIWSVEGLETARKVGMKRYKIAASVWRDQREFAETIIEEGKPVFVSGSPPPGFTNTNWLYCVSKYPAYPKDIDLLDLRYKRYYGYSDHAHGIEACLLAVSYGAEYIEKHVCLDKTDLVTRDTPFSATPDEFEQMVKIGNGIRRLLDAGN